MNTLILLLATAGVYTAQLDQLYNDDLVVTNVDMASKQDKLIAGENITISSDNVISATGGGGGGSDPNAVTNVFTNGISAVVGKVARITIPSIDGLASKQYVDTQDNKKLNNSNGSASLSWNNSYLKLSTSGRQSVNDNGFKSEKITDTRNSYAFFGSTGIQVEDELYDSEGEQVGESLVFIGTGAYDENGKTYIDYQDIGDEDSTRIYFSSIIDANTATTIVASASVTNAGAVADAAAKYLPLTGGTVNGNLIFNGVVDFSCIVASNSAMGVTYRENLTDYIKSRRWIGYYDKYLLADWNITNAYTKTECDNAFQPKGNYLTSESDPVWNDEKANYLTTQTADAKFVHNTFSNRIDEIFFGVTNHTARIEPSGIDIKTFGYIPQSGSFGLRSVEKFVYNKDTTYCHTISESTSKLVFTNGADMVFCNDSGMEFMTNSTSLVNRGASVSFNGGSELNLYGSSQVYIKDLNDIRVGGTNYDNATNFVNTVANLDSLWSQTNTKLTNTIERQIANADTTYTAYSQITNVNQTIQSVTVASGASLTILAPTAPVKDWIVYANCGADDTPLILPAGQYYASDEAYTNALKSGVTALYFTTCGSGIVIGRQELKPISVQ